MRHTLVVSCLLPALAIATAPFSAGGVLCFPPPHDANCLSWRVDASNLNITFSASIAADPSTGVPVWGAWGLPALTCGNMWPSYVWLILPSPSGGVRVEDRVAVTHAAPACAARAPQLSHTLTGAVAADGSVNVSWTRPLTPPPEFQQPAIARGATPLIGAYALGAGALAFPACGVAGLPFHSNAVNGVSADFLAGAASAVPSQAAGVPVARYSGLAGLFAVCGDSCAALTHLQAATGRVSFPSSATPSLFPLLTALDGSLRVVHTLAFDNSQAQRSSALFVASLSADTGALLGTCATRFALNDNYVLENLNFAFDAAAGEVLIASCTDASCVAPLNVTAIRPGSCATREISALAAEELSAGAGGSGAVDPYARVFVFSLARGGSKPGLALVALNISSGAIVRVTPEAPDTPYVQSLVFDIASRLIYGLAFTTAGYSQPLLVAVNARTGKLRSVGAIAGCAGALPDSLAVSADGARLFFVGAGAGGAATLFAVFTANATVSSAAPLQGALSLGDAPTALFWLP